MSDSNIIREKSKRLGMVVGIDPEKISEYKNLHAQNNLGVRDILIKYHMHHFSIFLQQMPDQKWYEFGYFEYTGNNYEMDMEEMAKEPRIVEWLKQCDPMQISLPNNKGWTEMECIYYNN
jgi:L-rhamnose mutarotase